MPEQLKDEKPCLVETQQGFSVSYKNKLLYSKYAPQKAILTAIEGLQVLPGTLFLCCSPVLPYGLKELTAKLDEKSFCLLCDFDAELSVFSANYFSSQEFKDDKAARLTLSELKALPQILNEPSYTTAEGVPLLPSGSFKRVIRLDFSAGVQLHPESYNALTTACTNAIMTFWSNRITLVKFGRKYSQNLFKNLRLLPKTTPIQSFFHSVTKPIIVFGAGESAEEGIRLIKNAAASSYYVLCADTALQPLLASGIQADGVFVEEAQTVIKKAFIGTQKSRTQIFAGLSALPHLDKIKSPKKLSFFTTLYTKAHFIERLQKQGILPPCNEPFGSVGLTAVYYALQFRKSEEVPVYLYGLDFSYSAGRTHARGTLAHKNKLIQSTRLVPIENYGAGFGVTAEKAASKNGGAVYTTRTLKNYAELFRGFFSGIKNLYDASSTGLPLGITQMLPSTGKTTELLTTTQKTTPAVVLARPEPVAPNTREELPPEFELAAPAAPAPIPTTAIKAFFTKEKSTLEELRDLLTGKIHLPPAEQQERITALAAPREYLYLHFADGIHFKYETSFLKRLRTEIDFFLKIFGLFVSSEHPVCKRS